MPSQPLGPPTYDDVAGSGPTDQLIDKELVCLILNGESIYQEGQPWRPAFQISNPPIEARASIYGIERVRYHLSNNDGDGEIRSRTDHIYDIRKAVSMNQSVEINGQSSCKRTYKFVTLFGGVNWLSCEAKGHFKAGQNMKQKLKHRDQIDWEDERGRLVAVETRAARQDEAIVDHPKLRLKMPLEAKDLDLLVACWVARVWKESQKERAEPMSWDRCK